ncbi:MAG TPA: hypothetical protein DEP84_26130 [Chloroflexi bacterium]|nr:hypothetical protein [Chloroflexota bacterium]
MHVLLFLLIPLIAPACGPTSLSLLLPGSSNDMMPPMGAKNSLIAPTAKLSAVSAEVPDCWIRLVRDDYPCWT